jgi:MurE/MurF fusion protein
LIAGKGHETGQIVGDRVLPFSDHEAVAAALAEGRMSATPAVDVEAMAAAMGAAGRGGVPARSPAFRSTAARSRRRGFFAIKGDVHDGHDFVARA